jgi:hypothetical protein
MALPPAGWRADNPSASPRGASWPLLFFLMPAAFEPPAQAWMQRGLLEASCRLVPCGRTAGAPQPPLLFWAVGRIPLRILQGGHG